MRLNLAEKSIKDWQSDTPKMELVLDANVLFSALIKEGLTSELLFLPNINLYAPDLLIEELLEYELFILEKASRSKEGLIGMLHLLNNIITMIPKAEFSDFLGKAKEISPDPDDFVYLALAMKLKCPIWSNDKRLKEQNEVKIYSTHELVKVFSHT